jgi:hypothetical protein
MSALASRAASATAGNDGVDWDRENGSWRGERTGLQARPLSLDMDLRELTFFMIAGEISVWEMVCLQRRRATYSGSTSFIPWSRLMCASVKSEDDSSLLRPLHV